MAFSLQSPLATAPRPLEVGTDHHRAHQTPGVGTDHHRAHHSHHLPWGPPCSSMPAPTCGPGDHLGAQRGPCERPGPCPLGCQGDARAALGLSPLVVPVAAARGSSTGALPIPGHPLTLPHPLLNFPSRTDHSTCPKPHRGRERLWIEEEANPRTNPRLETPGSPGRGEPGAMPRGKPSPGPSPLFPVLIPVFPALGPPCTGRG